MLKDQSLPLLSAPTSCPSPDLSDPRSPRPSCTFLLPSSGPERTRKSRRVPPLRSCLVGTSQTLGGGNSGCALRALVCGPRAPSGASPAAHLPAPLNHRPHPPQPPPAAQTGISLQKWTHPPGPPSRPAQARKLAPHTGCASTAHIPPPTQPPHHTCATGTHAPALVPGRGGGGGGGT